MSQSNEDETVKVKGLKFVRGRESQQHELQRKSCSRDYALNDVNTNHCINGAGKGGRVGR